MAEQKKKRGKRAYLDDFYLDLSGNYVYRGKMYHYTGALPRKTALIRAWAFAGAALAALIINGFLPVPALNGCFYVVVPYVGGLIAGCSVVWALGRITAAGSELREYVYKETAAQLPMRCMLCAVFSAAAAAGQLLYLFLNKAGESVGLMVLFTALQIIATVSAYKLKIFSLERFWSLCD